MAITTVATDTASISVRIQNDIYLQSIIPLAYATPMVLMMDAEPLRKRGKTMQHQFLVEQGEYADAASYEVTTIAENMLTSTPTARVIANPCTSAASNWLPNQ